MRRLISASTILLVLALSNMALFAPPPPPPPMPDMLLSKRAVMEILKTANDLFEATKKIDNLPSAGAPVKTAPPPPPQRTEQPSHVTDAPKGGLLSGLGEVKLKKRSKTPPKRQVIVEEEVSGDPMLEELQRRQRRQRGPGYVSPRKRAEEEETLAPWQLELQKRKGKKKK